MNLILSLLQKKPKKSTITEVDKKVDNLINILHKKRKVEVEEENCNEFIVK